MGDCERPSNFVGHLEGELGKKRATGALSCTQSLFVNIKFV